MINARLFLVAFASFGLVIAKPATAAGNDEIKLTFLGTGAPRPSHDRYGPAILVEAGDYKIMVDAGPGMRERLFQAGGFEMLTSVDHLLITHLHFDHTISAPGLWLTGWLFGRKVPMNVYGPTGTAAMMANFRTAYDWDIRYRTTVGVHQEGSELIAKDVGPGVFFDKGGLRITAFDVEHMPIDLESGESLGLEGATLGYRIDYGDYSVLFSGDTRSTPSSEIIPMGKGVDVLIHETQVPAPGDTPEARLANVSLSVHSTPAQVAYVFNQTRPRLGVYSHIIPPEIGSDELLGLTDYSGRMLVAEDLMTLTIGREITIGRAEGAGTDIFTESNVVEE
ncbi:MAG: MBL fold metallo-hydrolase [Proteobacteria bacterium]|nr:MBL fold metallo-hydrolase [Pseudomonadota bacterium]MDA0994298.1 MBL fold metallo-hydrolase [Pseudomonadota bacterium]